MKHARLVALALAALSGAVLAFEASCSSSSSGGAECQSGDVQQCTCDGGGAGTKTCAGTTFAACVCAAPQPDGGGGGDGGHEGGASTSGAAFGQYMGPCEAGTDCPSGDTCYDFTSKGSFCTHACDAAAQCAPPSPKCTPKGYCAVPD